MLVTIFIELIAITLVSISLLITFSLVVMIIGRKKDNPPFVPVRTKALPYIEELFMRYQPITADSVIIDPGCGDAKVLTYLAKKHPQARYIGIEINLIPYLIARFTTRNFNNITIVRGDIFSYDYTEATHVFTYLFPKLMDPLFHLITQQAKQPMIFISCDFAVSTISPTEIVPLSLTHASLGLSKKLYVYLCTR